MIPKKKATFTDYVKSGGWRKILKTSLYVGGVIASTGILYLSILAFKSYKTKMTLTEGSTLSKGSESSSHSHRPYSFVPKSDVTYGESLAFEMKEVTEVETKSAK